MSDTPLEAIVENRKAGHCFIRDRRWRRLFVSGNDCPNGHPPQPGTIVSFEVDGDDVRGPRARRLRTVREPDPDIVITCRDCGAEVRLTAGDQAWFAWRGLELPARCQACRMARRARVSRATRTVRET